MEKTVCGYHLAILTANQNKILGEYLFRFIQTQNVRSFFETNANGVTRFGLGKPTIENLFIPLPKIKEQEYIIEFLNQKTGVIDKSSNEILKTIDKLKSYRRSLISEAVTGKIDVRDWHLPS